MKANELLTAIGVGYTSFFLYSLVQAVAEVASYIPWDYVTSGMIHKFWNWIFQRVNWSMVSAFAVGMSYIVAPNWTKAHIVAGVQVSSLTIGISTLPLAVSLALSPGFLRITYFYLASSTDLSPARSESPAITSGENWRSLYWNRDFLKRLAVSSGLFACVDLPKTIWILLFPDLFHFIADIPEDAGLYCILGTGLAIACCITSVVYNYFTVFLGATPRRQDLRLRQSKATLYILFGLIFLLILFFSSFQSMSISGFTGLGAIGYFAAQALSMESMLEFLPNLFGENTFAAGWAFTFVLWQLAICLLQPPIWNLYIQNNSTDVQDNSVAGGALAFGSFAACLAAQVAALPSYGRYRRPHKRTLTNLQRWSLRKPFAAL